MGFIKNFIKNRKLKMQIEKMKLRSEILRQKNSLSTQKMKKTSQTVRTFAKLQQDLQDIQEIMPQNRNEFIQFMETDTGKQVVNGVFSFLSGLIGKEKSETESNLVAVYNKLTPDQKTKGIALFEQFMKGL